MPAIEEANTTKPKRLKVSQTEFPNHTLQQALRIARAIWDNFAGKGAAPHEIAMAIDMSPTSGTWRNLCGSSIAYGLTEGGYAASETTLTELGRRIVAPTDEDDDVTAQAEAGFSGNSSKNTTRPNFRLTRSPATCLSLWGCRRSELRRRWRS